MGCSSATFDPDEGGYQCAVSGNDCMYFMPDSKRCAEQYGEGPDANNEESKVEMPIMEFDSPNSNGRIYPKNILLHHEEKPINQIEFKDEIVGFSLVKK